MNTEYGNGGMMGLNKPIRPTHNDFFHFLPTIPLFHYTRIPVFHMRNPSGLQGIDLLHLKSKR